MVAILCVFMGEPCRAKDPSACASRLDRLLAMQKPQKFEMPVPNEIGLDAPHYHFPYSVSVRIDDLWRWLIPKQPATLSVESMIKL
jgi:hypothetical protein